MSVDLEALDEAAPERMTRAARRDQLLDTAAEIVAERGFEAVTMEGVAARAGVSKALPYNHFGNSDALIAALRDREITIITKRTIAAALSADSLADKIAAIVHVAFEGTKERGSMLVSIMRWLPQFEAKVHEPPPSTPFDWFLAEMFETELGLSKPVARVAQRQLGMGMVGAIDAWMEGHASQPEAEHAAVRMIVGGLEALAATSRTAAKRRTRRSAG